MGETVDAACRQDPQSCCCRSAELLARYEFDSLEKWLYSSEAHSLPLRGVEVAGQPGCQRASSDRDKAAVERQEGGGTPGGCGVLLQE